ncbi:hypothetical protein COLU111180_07245 [Cohnella lubricantis]|uniref:Uncharacterized protein n=1 Tax=Cohnella lubricantis TaxID=2163172 RepID=A0A841TEQ5_9BACL|nr:hypothetical protein [Cohnella lubricantis]MBB6678555.1 hypothetical protein [Cohnella lubricantis]MBP2119136.1 hypothetical protein [Cohnella lubricantis]
MVHAFFIEPPSYIAFDHEAELLDKCKEWGLLSEKASKAKTFYYKGNGMNEACEIVGYVDKLTAVIEFADKQKHCIHPSYLKEMQASTFGQRFAAKAESGAETGAESEAEAESAAEAGAASVSADSEAEADSAASSANSAGTRPSEAGTAANAAAAAHRPVEPAAKAAKPKAKKLELPEDKVRMTATVKAFTTVPNHFSDTDDEVVIYDAVAIAEPAIELGDAWSSYSATLKKLELAEGDTIAFDAKVVAKKLTKHPVPYKINNPSKIVKQ